MKKIAKALLVAAVITCGTMFTTGCALPFPVGCIYTKVTVPVTVGSGDIRYNREGTATCYSVLGWFAGGDASIQAACAHGQINKVSWANQEIQNWCGIYGKYTTHVYGFGDNGADLTAAPAANAKK